MRLTVSRASDLPVATLPRDPTFDATLDLFAEGYRFVSSRCRTLGSDAFETRLVLHRVICMLGEEAARLFYDGEHVTRRDAMSTTALGLLEHARTVRSLEGAAHRSRKRALSTVLSGESVRELGDAVDEAWRARAVRWRARGRAEDIVLHDEVREILFRAACAWAGIPTSEGEVEERTRELGAMVVGTGPATIGLVVGARLRRRVTRWARRLVEGARTGVLRIRPGSPLDVIAYQRDERGRLLEEDEAAGELLDVIRPLVAVARFVVFAALALHEHPDIRAEFAGADDAMVEAFVQEVRRFYPFFPAVSGRVRESVRFRGVELEPGTHLLFDLYGTNHDPRIWGDPEVFRPSRFFEEDVTAFSFVPQGGGDPMRAHRCPGEAATVEIMRRAVRWLARASYVVPPQDLRIDMAMVPALPASGFLVRDVAW